MPDMPKVLYFEADDDFRHQTGPNGILYSSQKEVEEQVNDNETKTIGIYQLVDTVNVKVSRKFEWNTTGPIAKEG